MDVAVTILDTRGALIATLVQERQDAGRHTVTWQGTNTREVPVAEGVYYVCLAAGRDVRVEPIVHLR
jgi:flagellar hook assembly protein FlgD